MTDLQALIGLRKGDRSYEQLSKACGGSPSAKRLHMLATAPMKNFPDPDTIRALSKGLGVTETTVVMASAESLGLDVRSPSGWTALLPAGIDRVPSHMRDSILSVVHSAVHMAEDMEVGSDGEPQPRRQATQQAGSAPKYKGDSGGAEVTPSWVAAQAASGNLASAGFEEGSDRESRPGSVSDVDPEARRG